MNPILARISVNEGHGAGKPTKKIIEEQADIYGFVLEATKVDGGGGGGGGGRGTGSSSCL